ncbi:hypothetical protein NCG97_22650 [Streptomyces lydicamycinicus]|uniref:hypothetical protein n=1 Tax=Streptomyces lydicamycinicus TaxID=1546107 RepID=UPI0020356058|nr:hypothetical protein [Streptomyces lydicamycinicus]USA02824.1 hypothetical protein NCG97_22650 [Streptomyces lydicamycinicus]
MQDANEFPKKLGITADIRHLNPGLKIASGRGGQDGPPRQCVDMKMPTDMIPTGQQIFTALSLYGSVEWIRTSSGRNPVEGYIQSPHVAWRFRGGSDAEMAQLIATLVSDTSTQEEWTLDHSSRNWLLAPSRVLHECATDSLTFRKEAVRITLSDPEFCERANHDLALIISRLRDYTRL